VEVEEQLPTRRSDPAMDAGCGCDEAVTRIAAEDSDLASE
jgi:hypothetical protein